VQLIVIASVASMANVQTTRSLFFADNIVVQTPWARLARVETFCRNYAARLYCRKTCRSIYHAAPVAFAT